MTQILNKMIHSDLEPFDILFRNFFESDAFFAPAVSSKPKYPVNIYECSESGLHIEVAVVGLSEEDIAIELKDGDTLTISHKGIDPSADQSDKFNWLHKGIAQRSFYLGWKIGNKFDLEQIKANVDKGLLSINIPIAADKLPRKITFQKNKK